MELGADTAYPLLLELYNDYTNKVLSKKDFINIITIIESYIFRRAVCEISTNSLNKTFASFSKNLKKEKYLESIQAHFLLLKSYTRFPSNDEFKEALIKKDFYHFAKKTYCFKKLENHKRKEEVSIDEYTIEHIMPQNLNKLWQKDLGEKYQVIHDKYLHTIGNLTLTGYNSEYGNKSFKEKQDMDEGFKQSPLRVNENLRTLEKWNENEIIKRADVLAQMSLKVWITPNLDDKILETYKAKKSVLDNKYHLSHYHFSDTTKELFELLRKEILALDDGISEIFTKRYISYKIDVNFVDIVVLSRSLKIYLKSDLCALRDEKKLARDVSNIGTFDNESVEIILDSKEHISYCVGLIRQSLEQQLNCLITQ